MQRINQSFRFERWAGLDLIACACNPALGVSCAEHYTRTVRANPLDTDGLTFRERRAMRDAYVPPTCGDLTSCPGVKQVHCAWSSCSRLYVPTRPGVSYCSVERHPGLEQYCNDYMEKDMTNESTLCTMECGDEAAVGDDMCFDCRWAFNAQRIEDETRAFADDVRWRYNNGFRKASDVRMIGTRQATLTITDGDAKYTVNVTRTR